MSCSIRKSVLEAHDKKYDVILHFSSVRSWMKNRISVQFIVIDTKKYGYDKYRTIDMTCNVSTRGSENHSRFSDVWFVGSKLMTQFSTTFKTMGDDFPIPIWDRIYFQEKPNLQTRFRDPRVLQRKVTQPDIIWKKNWASWVYWILRS